MTIEKIFGEIMKHGKNCSSCEHGSWKGKQGYPLSSLHCLHDMNKSKSAGLDFVCADFKEVKND